MQFKEGHAVALHLIEWHRPVRQGVGELPQHGAAVRPQEKPLRNPLRSSGAARKVVAREELRAVFFTYRPPLKVSW